MEILRKVGGVELTKGNLAANGLFNLFNTETEQVSFWFDEETKNVMMNLSDDEFI